jgi:5-methylcytosine-specific restriction endonuclease McrA
MRPKIYSDEERKLRAADRKRKWALENKEKADAARKKWRVANGEREKAVSAEYRNRNGEAIRARHAAYRRENAEKEKMRHDKYRMENKDRIREYGRQYYKKNKERMLRYIKERRLLYPEIVTAANARRRATRLKARGGHTAADIRNLVSLQKGRCGYCKTVVGRLFHVDHIVPMSKGGGNDRRNIQILCGTCNMRKNAKDPLDFAREIGLLL